MNAQALPASPARPLTVLPELLARSGSAPTLRSPSHLYTGFHNLSASLALSDLAALVSLSPHHFCRQFKAATGKTVHQFVIEQRVERAIVLLSRGHLPVTSVAAEVGFAEQTHLARHIKRLLGVSPKALRRS